MRNTLGLERENLNWVDRGIPVSTAYRASEEAVIVAVRKTLNMWAHKYTGDELDAILDYLENAVVCSTKDPKDAEFTCGDEDSHQDNSLQQLLDSGSWISALGAKRKPVRAGHKAGSEWQRIFGALMPFVDQIDFVDGYLVDDLIESKSILEEIIKDGFGGFRGRLVLHFLHPKFISDDPKNIKSLSAVARRLSAVSSPLETTAKKKFEVRLYRKQVESRSKMKFHDRHLHFSFSDCVNGLHFSMGHGVNTFDPERIEGTLGIVPQGSWNGIQELLRQLSLETATEELRKLRATI